MVSGISTASPSRRMAQEREAQAVAIVKLFGGADPFANAMGVDRNDVHNYLRRGIPPRVWPRVVAAARKTEKLDELAAICEAMPERSIARVRAAGGNRDADLSALSENGST